MGFVIVSPPMRLGVGEGDGISDDEAGVGGAGQKGWERSSGYVWKNRGANVEPKNAP